MSSVLSTREQADVLTGSKSGCGSLALANCECVHVTIILLTAQRFILTFTAAA